MDALQELDSGTMARLGGVRTRGSQPPDAPRDWVVVLHSDGCIFSLATNWASLGSCFGQIMGRQVLLSAPTQQPGAKSTCGSPGDLKVDDFASGSGMLLPGRCYVLLGLSLQLPLITSREKGAPVSNAWKGAHGGDRLCPYEAEGPAGSGKRRAASLTV